MENTGLTQAAIARIRRMEEIYDEVSAALQSTPDALLHPSIRAGIALLRTYYEDGEWLSDYELDERRLLPSGMKRGVLSEDGLYDLLCAVDARFRDTDASAI